MSEITNEVIVERIEGLKNLMTEKFANNTEENKRIEEQTKKTNGRVNHLEDEMFALQAWKNKMVGAIIVTECVLLPMALYFIYKIIIERI